MPGETLRVRIGGAVCVLMSLALAIGVCFPSAVAWAAADEASVATEASEQSGLQSPEASGPSSDSDTQEADESASGYVSSERAAAVQSSQMGSLADAAVNAGDADAGSASNPYRIVVSKGAFCAPSKFWTNGGRTIPDMALLFENREGGSLSGELIASYAMDTSLRNRDNLNESWSPAFRFSPYVETSIEDGKLRFATASKGSFETYFPTFQFRLNVAYLTKGLPDDQRIEAGDQVVVSYYGNYSASQTDRGANYSIDFSVEDSSYQYQREFTVESDGFITIDPLPVGGNYEVSLADPEKPLYSGNIGIGDRAESGEGTGSADDPYVFAVAPTVGSGASINPYTRPSQFWGVSQAADSGIAAFAVEFRQFYGGGSSGTLLSSMSFDTISKKNSAWSNFMNGKLRLSPVAAFDTSDGGLRVAFAWKGCFAKYFSDWTFKLDVQGLTSELAEGKRVKPGDTVYLTYYGNYQEGQTSGGTNYSIDFSVEDANVVSQVEAVVGDDGYAEFSGDQMLEYGGNYVLSLERQEPSPNPPDGSGDGGEGSVDDGPADKNPVDDDSEEKNPAGNGAEKNDFAADASSKNLASTQSVSDGTDLAAASGIREKVLSADSDANGSAKADAGSAVETSAVVNKGASSSSGVNPESANTSEGEFPYGMAFAAVAAVALAASVGFLAFVSSGRGRVRARVGK